MYNVYISSFAASSLVIFVDNVSDVRSCVRATTIIKIKKAMSYVRHSKSYVRLTMSYVRLTMSYVRHSFFNFIIVVALTQLRTDAFRLRRVDSF